MRGRSTWLVVASWRVRSRCSPVEHQRGRVHVSVEHERVEVEAQGAAPDSVSRATSEATVARGIAMAPPSASAVSGPRRRERAVCHGAKARSGGASASDQGEHGGDERGGGASGSGIGGSGGFCEATGRGGALGVSIRSASAQRRPILRPPSSDATPDARHSASPRAWPGLAGVAQTQDRPLPRPDRRRAAASLRAANRPTSYGHQRRPLRDHRPDDRGRAGLRRRLRYTGVFVPFDCNPSRDPARTSSTAAPGSTRSTRSRSPAQRRVLVAGRDDLHNLFPTQVESTRTAATCRFAEIPTRRRRGGTAARRRTTRRPSRRRTSTTYSELRHRLTRFEPREDHEGNVARAMFYVETCTPTDTGDAWFTPQMRTLYDWHHADPITAADQAPLEPCRRPSRTAGTTRSSSTRR